MIRFRYPSAHALRDALENWLDQPAATMQDGDTPIPVDVYREGAEVVVEAALPGAKLDDIELSCEPGLLSIRAQMPETRRNYAVHERPTGGLSRVLALPTGCILEEARASLREGVLRVTLPMPRLEGSHTIKVEIASDVNQPSTIVMESPGVVDAVKGKDYRDVDPRSQPRRRRSK